MSLIPCPNAPCIFHGELIPNKPPIYVGIYVDDFMYFSTDSAVEKEFETTLSRYTDVEFMGDVSHFLGMKFTWTRDSSSVSVHLSQPAFVDHLVSELGLSSDSSNIPRSPYRSGLTIDSIPTLILP